MRPTVAPNIVNAATNGMVMSLSMRNLLSIISAVPGLAFSDGGPGTAGLRILYAGKLSTIVNGIYMILNCCADILLKCLTNVRLRQLTDACFTIWLEFDLVNISGKYQGSWRPGPAETCAPVFCLPSRPGIASMERCPAWLPAWHSSASPHALYCKALPLISYLLY